MSSATEKRQIFSWALYDWANSAFATTVMAGFFPLFFKQFWAANLPVVESTFRLGLANTTASALVAVMAPLMGAIADKRQSKKSFLSTFAILGMLMTATLFFVGSSQWQLAMLVYIVAIIGFSGANLFYDSLLTDVARKDQRDFVSALGFALGYLGGGLLFALNVFMSLKPEFFGLAASSMAVRISFLTVALWWFVFSLPLFFFVHEPRSSKTVEGFAMVVAGLKQLRATLGKIRKLRAVALFLLAYWLYIDGVQTMVRMAVDYGMSLGLNTNHLIIALLLTQFVGFPAALFFGWLGKKWDVKKSILVAIGVYTLITLRAYSMQSSADFYLLAVCVGLVQGGVQALSRSYYTRLIPKNQVAEFFGFYNMWGRFAAILGPLFMGWVAVATGSSRSSVFVLILLFVSGGLLLATVKEPAKTE